ncbi:lysosome-associated membrane glycoprotein 1 [Drosophila mojavensis]|uniref:Lysosome-associated membrane glycoprotein 5 n=1 Tax=Drosophila mojavensis TaxID=7230 RepID=B4KEW6_DROMO|nr:lysosome-associated membrane glycoprotein 1 [Drosophila mojavensis]EDW11935.2 uncharacterized protein Dmoj_GI12441 [Drosophila mojavensis]
MFGHKFIICTTLLLLSSSVYTQSLSMSLKDAQFPEQEKPLTSSSSSSSTSTTSTTTSTTKPPPTSSSSSTSTTSTTTTTTVAPTTSTTVAPSTSTPAPVPTTTRKPQPYPDPTVGTWNCSCIMLTMAAQLNFTYETKSGNMTNGLFNVPSNAKLDHCLCDSPITQFMQLNWGPIDGQESLVLQLENKNKSVSLTLIKVVLPLAAADFPDAKENQTIQLIHQSPNTDFKTPEKMSYHCTRVQKLNMTETISGNNTIGTISVSHVQVEGFRSANATGFSSVHDCDSSETSDVVPIAVGIALAALILVVLISYLCARRRSTSRGYMSF